LASTVVTQFPHIWQRNLVFGVQNPDVGVFTQKTPVAHAFGDGEKGYVLPFIPVTENSTHG
jgi:hypothetical protein